jgi:hexosaminidase
MKTQALAMILCQLVGGAVAADSNHPELIPIPRKVEWQQGALILGDRIQILAEDGAEQTGQYLAGQIGHWAHATAQVTKPAQSNAPHGVLLTLAPEARALGDEGYALSVSPDGVTIRARTEAGLFYGVQTLLQLLPVQGTSASRDTMPGLKLPCVQIEDEPRFKWRGLMLDVARHFFTTGEVKQLLDAMAAYKLNTFHWHLVDDQGWRIEIKQFPRLTELGAWRKGIGFGLDPKLSHAYGKDGRYGGFYTQQDIREVVEFARARHITVVPEIEMPGHASAALTAYPQYSCTGGPFTTDLPGGVFDGIYCAGNDQSFTFLEGVLKEVFELFPGKYVHIGGDEVLTNNWHQCPKCQARLKQEGLTKDMELESYFIRRMEKFINAQGRNLIGWSEIREGGLAPSAAIMDWVGGAVEAAGSGHDVVMSPLADCYFDHYQSTNHSTEPHAIGGYLPLRQVYAFEPFPKGLATEYQPHILGAQANVWTEYMPSIEHVEYMVFPRLCALAEVVWSPQACRNWQDFAGRIKTHYTRLAAMGINYRKESGWGLQGKMAK